MTGAFTKSVKLSWLIKTKGSNFLPFKSSSANRFDSNLWFDKSSIEWLQIECKWSYEKKCRFHSVEVFQLETFNLKDFQTVLFGCSESELLIGLAVTNQNGIKIIFSQIDHYRFSEANQFLIYESILHCLWGIHRFKGVLAVWVAQQKSISIRLFDKRNS